jgi:hypothetical protein
MTYEIAKVMNTTTTHGWLFQTADSQTNLKAGTFQAVISGAKETVGSDIVTAINGESITNSKRSFNILRRKHSTQPNH